MTDARDKTAAGGDKDQLVSETYREIAQEKTPEHLDRSILDTAAKSARPRYSLLIGWTRPAAWAATIMLSVALVYEFSQTPELLQPKMDASAPIADPEESAERDKRGRVIKNAEDLQVQDMDLLQRADEMARIQQGQDDQPAQLPPRQKEHAPAAAMSAKSALQSNDMLEDGTNPCGATATAEPESWLACIMELEAAGLTDIAREQRALLAETFPDFDSR